MISERRRLIDQFFTALNLKQPEQCRTILDAVERLAGQDPACHGWHLYLSGNFVNEFERDWAKSERLFQTLLVRDDIDPYLRGRTLRALGVAYDHQGRWPEAFQVYEQCLTFFNDPDQGLDRAKVWHNMAVVLELGFTQGEFDAADLDRAATYSRLALETLQGLTPPNDETLWTEAITWNTLILIYLNLGRWRQARDCCERCLTLCRRIGDRYGVGLASNNLGEVWHHQGPKYWLKALQAYQKALKIYREFEDTYEEIDVRANLALLHWDRGDLAAALDHYEQALSLIEQLRAGVTSETAQAGFFATVVNIYANAVLLNLEKNDGGQAFNIIERARSRAFLDSLTIRSPGLAEKVQQAEQAAVPTMTLADIQTALPADALLLEYFTTGLVETQTPGARRRMPPAKILIFAVTAGDLAVHEAAISPNDLHPGRLDNIVERHFLEPQIRRALYDQLLAPAAALLSGKRILYLIPHGPLHYIPFQALLAPGGGTFLRADGPQLVYAPSATLLFRSKDAPAAPASRRCLALGYNNRGATQLLFAEAEARRVAHLTGGQALTGTAPKKAMLFKQARAYRLLHLACHGEFDPENPLASFLNLAPQETLTALDVLENLRLRCDLVTLSACESGLSRVRRGDELVGFTRAFMYAGAPALLSTLWRVNDHSTRILMNKFYQEIQAGLGFAAALKQAQLFVKELTYREALEILTGPVDPPAGEGVSPPISGSEAQAGRTGAPLTFSQAKSYLRGLVSRGRAAVAKTPSAEPAPDEKVFADPYYWAAFILVGDHGS